MIRKKKRSITDVLNDPNNNLGKIIEKAKSIEILQKKLQSDLPQPIANHTWVGTYESGILTLMVDSSAIATQLRFSVPEIRENLRQQPQWYGLKSINVKIIVNPPKPIAEILQTEEKNTPNNAFKISKNSAQMLEQLADTIDDSNGGDQLKKSLMRLARLGEK